MIGLAVAALALLEMKSTVGCKLVVVEMTGRKFDNCRPLLVTDCSSFTVSNDAPLMMACSRGDISSSSSSVVGRIEYDSKAATAS